MEFHKALGFILIFPNHVTIVFGFCTFQEAVEITSIPALYLLQFMAKLSLHHSLSSMGCCQNLAVCEPFVEMLWSFAFKYRCVLVIIHTAFNFTVANGSPAEGPTTADISATDTASPAHATTDVVAHPTVHAATSSTADAKKNQYNNKCSCVSNSNLNTPSP